MANETQSKVKLKDRLWRHPEVAASVVGAVGIVLGSMLPLYCKHEKEDSPVPVVQDSCVTTVYTDMRKFSIWNDSKDYYIWFNAQYALANSTQFDNHYINLIRKMRCSFYLVKPTNASAADMKNFRDKFADFRSFFKKMHQKGVKDDINIREHLKEVFIVEEERRPSLSFFMTKDRDTDNEKVIVYIEDPKLIDDHRIPQMCIISEDQILIEFLKSRINDLNSPRALEYDKLIDDKIPDEELWK